MLGDHLPGNRSHRQGFVNAKLFPLDPWKESSMKKLLLLSVIAFAAGEAALAQDRVANDRVPARNLRREETRREETTMIPTPSLTSATPEMWFYEQERARQESPKYAVRRKAELRSTQRQQRLAAMKWYGVSNSRPTANPTPLFSTYSPTWVSGAADPLRWHAGGPSIYVVAQPREIAYERR
jgi:hypothetical protein